MRFIKEEIKNITLFEQPETNEALTLLYRKKKKLLPLKLFIILLFTLGTLFLVLYFCNTDYMQYIACYLYVPAIILTGVYIHIMLPYYELYKIARHNDRIRNDEHIRYNERKRLDTENVNNNNKLDKAKIESTINKLNISTQIDKKEIKQDKKVLPPRK